MRFEVPPVSLEKEQDPTRRWAEREQSMLERAARLGVEEPVLASVLERVCVQMTERLRAAQETSV